MQFRADALNARICEAKNLNPLDLKGGRNALFVFEPLVDRAVRCQKSEFCRRTRWSCVGGVVCGVYFQVSKLVYQLQPACKLVYRLQPA